MSRESDEIAGSARSNSLNSIHPRMSIQKPPRLDAPRFPYAPMHLACQRWQSKA